MTYNILYCTRQFIDIAVSSSIVVEIGFSPSVYTVNEDGVFVVIIVENRNPDIERTVVVQVNTVPGTADEGMCSRHNVYYIIILLL